MNVPGSCFEKYFPRNYLIIDCETLLKNSGEPECGSVAFVNHNRETVYKTKVFHPPNSLKVNSFTIKCNGFKHDSLCDPEYPKLDEVSNKVEEFIAGKLFVLIGGDNGKQNNDLISLRLDASKILVYNSHFHFFKTTFEKTIRSPVGEDESAFLIEPISLRRLCLKYFDIDIQTGVHDPETDAKYTARIFQGILLLMLKPGLQNFVEYDINNTCAYQERYIDFDDEPEMIDFNSKIPGARKGKVPLYDKI